MPVALITGCSEGGIGNGIAQGLLARGITVVATDIYSIDKMKNLDCDKMVLDVNDKINISKVVKAIMDKHGRIDILINNAGYAAYGCINDVPVDDIRKQYETNVFAVIEMVQQVSPIMANQKSGKIINVGSIISDLNLPVSGVYSSSKAAIRHLTMTLRQELRPFNIQVCLVQPGIIASGFWSGLKLFLPSQDSIFYKFFENIKKFAISIGNVKDGTIRRSTPVQEFTSKLCDMAVRETIPGNWRYGAGAFESWISSLFPQWLLDFEVRRRYSIFNEKLFSLPW